MGGQLDGNFLPGSLPHKYILIVTLIMCFVVHKFLFLFTTALLYSLHTYLCDVWFWTETGVYAPGVSTFAEQLCIEVRVHLHQQTSPPSLSLQIYRIRRPLAVQRSALDVETLCLSANNSHDFSGNLLLSGESTYGHRRSNFKQISRPIYVEHFYAKFCKKPN